MFVVESLFAALNLDDLGHALPVYNSLLQSWADIEGTFGTITYIKVGSSMAQSAPKIAFLAKISWLYRFSTMPDRMAWSNLKLEVVFCPFCACAVQTGLKVPLK